MQRFKARQMLIIYGLTKNHNADILREGKPSIVKRSDELFILFIYFLIYEVLANSSISCFTCP